MTTTAAPELFYKCGSCHHQLHERNDGTVICWVSECRQMGISIGLAQRAASRDTGSEPTGTYACPICGSDEPHVHPSVGRITHHSETILRLVVERNEAGDNTTLKLSSIFGAADQLHVGVYDLVARLPVIPAAPIAPAGTPIISGSLMDELAHQDATRPAGMRDAAKAYAHRDMPCGLSWDGFVIEGDEASIKEVRRLMHREQWTIGIQKEIDDGALVRPAADGFVMDRPANACAFNDELDSLINRYSMENGSDTPDFILGQFMRHSLQAFNEAVKARSKWYGQEGIAAGQGDDK